MTKGIRFISKLDQVMGRIERGTDTNLRKAGEIWRAGLIRTLTGNRSGEWYRVPGTKTQYRASAPGEPPASATGRLRSSIEVRTGRRFVDVGTAVRYALHLERGTTKMKPRPFMRPGFESVRLAVEAALKMRIR